MGSRYVPSLVSRIKYTHLLQLPIHYAYIIHIHVFYNIMCIPTAAIIYYIILQYFRSVLYIPTYTYS